MKWSKNNRACGATWTALLVLDQNRKPFPSSEDVTIGTFPIWAQGESPKLREVRARSLATMLDNVFRDFEGSKYEEGITRPKAIGAVTAVLTDDEKTLLELADVVDDHYRFVEEDA